MRSVSIDDGITVATVSAPCNALVRDERSDHCVTFASILQSIPVPDRPLLRQLRIHRDPLVRQRTVSHGGEGLRDGLFLRGQSVWEHHGSIHPADRTDGALHLWRSRHLGRIRGHPAARDPGQGFTADFGRGRERSPSCLAAMEERA